MDSALPPPLGADPDLYSGPSYWYMRNKRAAEIREKKVYDWQDILYYIRSEYEAKGYDGFSKIDGSSVKAAMTIATKNLWADGTFD